MLLPQDLSALRIFFLLILKVTFFNLYLLKIKKFLFIYQPNFSKLCGKGVPSLVNQLSIAPDQFPVLSLKKTSLSTLNSYRSEDKIGLNRGFIRQYYRAIKGDTRSLDYSSHFSRYLWGLWFRV